MKKKLSIYLFLIIGSSTSLFSNAQIEQNIEQEDTLLVATIKNDFQPLFFKALSERGIENYEKAVETLETLLINYKEKPELHFQLALNYFDLEKYNLALLQFTKADSLKPNDFDIQEGIFKVHEQQKQYEKAIDIANVLALKDPEYYEILANIYFITRQYKKALHALDKADNKQGFDTYKEQLREAIFKDYNNPQAAISYYQNREKIEPYNPINTYRVIFFLTKDKRYEEALIKSKKAFDKYPRFSRFYLLQVEIFLKINKVEQALMSLKTLVKDRFLEEKYKVQAIDKMKNYVNTHPDFRDDFVQVLNIASESAESTASFLDLGLFYFKTDKPKALHNFKKALEQNPQDFLIWKNIATLQFELEQYQEAIKTTESALEIYPNQAIFFLLKGQSLINITQYNKAKAVLIEAETYLYKEDEMMLGVFTALSTIYKKLNEFEQAENYQNKANKLKQKLNNK